MSHPETQPHRSDSSSRAQPTQYTEGATSESTPRQPDARTEEGNYEVEVGLHIDTALGGQGDRDKQELARSIAEAIREQLPVANEAYTAVAEQLSKRPEAVNLDEFKQLFDAKDKEWQANGIYDYLAEQFIRDGAQYTLVATPNINVNGSKIVALGEAFNEGNDPEVRVTLSSDEKIDHNWIYSPAEWSGRVGSRMARMASIVLGQYNPQRKQHKKDPVLFSLIPSKEDSDFIPSAPVAQHAEMLKEKQAEKPRLHLHIPSVLEAITWWYVRRAKGEFRDPPPVPGNEGAWDRTAVIYHFDMEPRRVFSESEHKHVPLTYLENEAYRTAADDPSGRQNVVAGRLDFVEAGQRDNAQKVGAILAIGSS
jgi:hypothetical protein